MDDSVRRSMEKFPNTPVVYGWLRLDRRGTWWIRTARIDHYKIRAFIGRNYDVDERGCYYFQNGAQRVFAELDATPWVYSVAEDSGDGLCVLTHTDQVVEQIVGAYLSDTGDLLLDTEFGVGVVNDRDLVRAYGLMCDAQGDSLGEDAVLTELESLLETGVSELLYIDYRDTRVKVQAIQFEDVADTFGFVPKPTKAIPSCS